ncbi:cyclopropane-fatty-acyl-phospholipid synthase family protein [Coralliovum pocilloporae]|uniref:cyclopropane-fatty-acyl-phospholipid synthase family protein n=1 Tax=Coralliovum pocilloporae TaxID=3066369 RepID=UPI0033079B27
MTDKHVKAVGTVTAALAPHLDINASVELWDGSRLPLGTNVSNDLAIRIKSPGTIASLLKRPTLDRFILHYIHGDVDLTGGNLFDLGDQLALKKTGRALKKAGRSTILKALLPFLLVKSSKPGESRGFGKEITGENRAQADNKDFIQFHYDLSNDFYKLFLDREMLYSCAYFTDWGNSLEQAQFDKLDMICRKLRLKEGERFLDIGCGWGALVCHAVQHYGVTAHGVTLSEEQLALARAKINSLGLSDRITLELKDYAHLEGQFDKIASVGMYEHIGSDNIPLYMSTVKRLLADDGLFLNHAITRRGKQGKKKKFSKRAEQKALLKYIFPGGELDDIGNTLLKFETHGFEVHDVEGWREHYALTTRYWYLRLEENKEQAIALVGEEAYRIWAAYLMGVSLAFTRGTARIYQTLVSKGAKGPAPVPPSRADLYRD